MEQNRAWGLNITEFGYPGKTFNLSETAHAQHCRLAQKNHKVYRLKDTPSENCNLIGWVTLKQQSFD